MPIEHQYPVVMHYSEVRGIIYVKLVEAVAKYIKIDLLEGFELLNPHRLAFPDVESSEDPNPGILLSLEDLYIPGTEDDLHEYESYNARALFICGVYHLSSDYCNTFISEWTTVINCVTSSPQLRKIGADDATDFWPFALTQCEYSWTELTRDTVESVLVTSSSSSECERGFSIMNSIKTKGRSRIEKETLDAIMRVKINGPDLDKFYSYAYTIEFLRKFVRVDDPEFKNQFLKRSNQSPVDPNAK